MPRNLMSAHAAVILTTVFTIKTTNREKVPSYREKMVKTGSLPAAPGELTGL
jgi:hypothetical protein